MKFKPGQIIIRNGTPHKVIYVDESSILLESSIDNCRISIPMTQIIKEYMDSTVYMEGTMSPWTKQQYRSEKQQKRIEFRKPYAKAFGAGMIARHQCKYLIERIYRDCNHHILFPKNKPPSRASCYRWAKKVRDNFGDYGALQND